MLQFSFWAPTLSVAFNSRQDEKPGKNLMTALHSEKIKWRACPRSAEFESPHQLLSNKSSCFRKAKFTKRSLNEVSQIEHIQPARTQAEEQDTAALNPRTTAVTTPSSHGLISSPTPVMSTGICRTSSLWLAPSVQHCVLRLTGTIACVCGTGPRAGEILLRAHGNDYIKVSQKRRSFKTANTCRK
ncbi:unnamed protein product [Nyctereutes procyonoides]|uniref:(raccoon dog) hypothetical protein n=1 Tax=Nyctereutes procyonoides TaxID=34880 RepID=A0A811ZMQ1_NYCPR|nr:unnamed protein product [Nyctereutes procyonoides]